MRCMARDFWMNLLIDSTYIIDSKPVIINLEITFLKGFWLAVGLGV